MDPNSVNHIASFTDNIQFISDKGNKINYYRFSNGKFKERVFKKKKEIPEVVCKVIFYLENQAPKSKIKEVIESLSCINLNTLLIGKKIEEKNRSLFMNKLLDKAEKRIEKNKNYLNEIKDSPIIQGIFKTANQDGDFCFCYDTVVSKSRTEVLSYLRNNLLSETETSLLIRNKITRKVMKDIISAKQESESFDFLIALHKYRKVPSEQKYSVGRNLLLHYFGTLDGSLQLDKDPQALQNSAIIDNSNLGSMQLINVSADVVKATYRKFQNDETREKAFEQAEAIILQLLSHSLISLPLAFK